MEQDDFLPTEPIDKCLITRKIDTNKVKVNWLKTRWIQFKKSDPKIAYFKETSNEDFPFREINIASSTKTCFPETLPKLRNEDVKIKAAKIADLNTLLDYVPPIHHNFYKRIHIWQFECRNSCKSRPRKEYVLEHISVADDSESESLLDECFEEDLV